MWTFSSYSGQYFINEVGNVVASQTFECPLQLDDGWFSWRWFISFPHDDLQLSAIPAHCQQTKILKVTYRDSILRKSPFVLLRINILLLILDAQITDFHVSLLKYIGKNCTGNLGHSHSVSPFLPESYSNKTRQSRMKQTLGSKDVSHSRLPNSLLFLSCFGCGSWDVRGWREEWLWVLSQLLTSLTAILCTEWRYLKRQMELK